MLQAAEDEAATAVDRRHTIARTLSMEEQLAKKRQIFAPQEAYKMLARELKDMMLTPSNGVAVDAIGTSVWQWDMWLTDFDASSLLAQASPSTFLTALLYTTAQPLGKTHLSTVPWSCLQHFACAVGAASTSCPRFHHVLVSARTTCRDFKQFTNSMAATMSTCACRSKGAFTPSTPLHWTCCTLVSRAQSMGLWPATQ